MEKFRVTIKRRIILLSGMTLITVILGIYGFYVGNGVGSERVANEIILEFQFGLIFGIGIITLIHIIKLSMVINHDKKLNILYNKEHDERLKTICSKAGMPILMITSVMLMIGAVIAGYFNIVVFYTLVITAIVQLSIGTILKLYYLKTM